MIRNTWNEVYFSLGKWIWNATSSGSWTSEHSVVNYETTKKSNPYHAGQSCSATWTHSPCPKMSLKGVVGFGLETAVMLVTTSSWWLYDVDSLRCWWQNNYVGTSPTAVSNIRHQYLCSLAWHLLSTTRMITADSKNISSVVATVKIPHANGFTNSRIATLSFFDFRNVHTVALKLFVSRD